MAKLSQRANEALQVLTVTLTGAVTEGALRERMGWYADDRDAVVAELVEAGLINRVPYRGTHLLEPTAKGLIAALVGREQTVVHVRAQGGRTSVAYIEGELTREKAIELAVIETRGRRVPVYVSTDWVAYEVRNGEASCYWTR